MSTATAPVPPPSIFLCLLRVVALLGLVCGISLVSGLFLLPFFPSVHRLFTVLVMAQAPTYDFGAPVMLVTIVLTPFVIGFAARRLPLDTRGRVFLGLVVLSTLVINLVVVAWFPSARESYGTAVNLSLRTLALAGATLLAVTLAVRRLMRVRTLRGLVYFIIALGAILTFDLMLLAYVQGFLDDVHLGRWSAFSIDADNRDTLIDLAVVAGLFGVVPVIVFSVAWWRRWNSWRWIGGAYLALVPVLVYLATDDAVIRRPMSMDEIAPAFPGAEKSYAVLMRYGQKQAVARNLTGPDKLYPVGPSESIDPSKPVEWNTWLTTHRRAIEDTWANLAPVRAWWQELNSFDRIGDLTPSSIDAEYVSFAPQRLICQVGCGIAGLQAMEGHRDEAVETVLPLLEVARKLQPSSRSLVRTMVAIIVEKMAIQTINNILDRGPLSPTMRARVLAALSASGGGAAGARRLVAIHYAYLVDLSVGKGLGDLMVPNQSVTLRPALNAISPFIYNRRATLNLYGDYVASAQELMATRQFTQLDPDLNPALKARPGFKNFGGALLINQGMPASAKIGPGYWRTQDMRTALVERLNKT